MTPPNLIINHSDIRYQLEILVDISIAWIQPEILTLLNSTITIISSIYSYLGKIKRFPYSVSKHALNGLVKNLAIEMSRDNIRVNSVTPGFIDTKLTRRNLSEEEIQKIKKTIPCGDLGTVDDIANVVIFLSSDNAKYINGQGIIVDGGFICGGFLGLE